MPKDEEKQKHEERGMEFSPQLEALEDARDAFHSDPHNEQARLAFHAAQKVVADARVSERKAREAAGPPANAVDVLRDADGRAFGWNTAAGDATTAPGGVA